MYAAVEVLGLKQVLTERRSGSRFTLSVRQLQIPAGEFVGIVGDSGSGKTTLLTFLGLIRTRTADSSLHAFRMRFRGETEARDLIDLWYYGRNREAMLIRRRHLGFALQSGELISSLTVAENVMAPLKLNGVRNREARLRATGLLRDFQLDELAGRRTGHISGGQYQRVALARSIAVRPDIVFVDEPTASLNRAIARQSLQQLRSAVTETGSTIVMITHDSVLAEEFCDRIVHVAPVEGSEHPAGRVVKCVSNRNSNR